MAASRSRDRPAGHGLDPRGAPPAGWGRRESAADSRRRHPRTGGAVNSSSPRRREKPVTSITTKYGSWIYCKDWGSGQLVVFRHG
jgi:hypothetical protein